MVGLAVMVDLVDIAGLAVTKSVDIGVLVMVDSAHMEESGVIVGLAVTELVDTGVLVTGGTVLIGDLAMVMDGRVDIDGLAISHGICIVQGGHTVHVVIRITTTVIRIIITPIVTDLVFG